MRKRKVNWRIVESSNVSAVGWCKAGMLVLYKTGSLYLYRGVTRQRAVMVANAKRLTRGESVGAYINREIKGSYRYRRIA